MTMIINGTKGGTLPVLTYATLPASPVEGMLVGVSDSNSQTFNDTIASSGAYHVMAYYNGTNWVVR